MAKKPSFSDATPLDLFLGRNNLNNDRLTAVARRIAKEPFHSESLRVWLIPRLEFFKYPQPQPGSDRKTFHEILENAGALPALLHDQTLRMLWRCLLLKKIVAEDRELQRNGIASSGESLQSHRKKARQIQKELDLIVTMGPTYRARELAEKLYDIVERQLHIHRNLASDSSHAVARSELLGSQAQGKSQGRPRDEERATQVAIYRVLKARLQTSVSRRKGVSGIFLCQLSELISRGIGGPSFLVPRADTLTDGTSLWQAVKRSEG